WQDANGLGVVGLASTTSPTIDQHERLGLLFSPSIVLNQVTFTLVDQSGNGDQFVFYYNGGSQSQSIGGSGTVTFDLAAAGFTTAQRTGGQFYFGGDDGNDDFAIAGVQVNYNQPGGIVDPPAVVPLPASLWMRLSGLGGLALLARLRRNRVQVI